MGKGTRAFVITNWNCNTAEWYEKNKLQVRFVAFGDEVCPQTGRKHHQCFVYYHNQRSDSVKNLGIIGSEFGDIHCYVKPMKGNFVQNESYCSKEKLYTKLGDEPKQGFRGDIKETVDEIVKRNIDVDTIALEDPAFYHQYGRTLREVEAIALRKRWRTEMTEGIWYQGPTGVGKSHRAFNGYNPDTHFIKNIEDDWWDGYKGQEIVIINEFRGQIRYGELLDLIDKWPKTVKWRNREPVPFLAKKVIITSSKHPSEIYSNFDDKLDQLYRRIKIIQINEDGSEVLRGNIRGPELPIQEPEETVEESAALADASKADGLQPSGFIGLDSALGETAVEGRSAGPAARGLASLRSPWFNETAEESDQGSLKYNWHVANTRATMSVTSAPDRSYAAIQRQ